MKEAFDLIKERLEEKKKKAHDMHGKPHMDYGTLIGWESAMMYALDVVSEVEAEYINKSTEHINKLNDCSSNWIPCSERLPHEGQKVLGCVNPSIAKHEIILAPYESYCNSWHDGTLIAWMPLPEPFKGV